MNLNILLQTPVTTGVSEGVSTLSLFIFWGGLAICVLLFIYFLRRTDRIIAEEAKLKHQEVDYANMQINHGSDVHEEEAAAIAMAISMYKSQMHDMESFTITLKKVSRIYSPWSSKIYTLRQNPRY